MISFFEQSRFGKFTKIALACAAVVALLAGCGGGGGGGGNDGGGGGGGGSTATITGQLKDKASSSPLPNRTVTVQGTKLTGISNSTGQFTITGVTVGTISLSIVDSNGTSDGSSGAINLNSISGTTKNVGVILLNVTAGPGPPPPPIT